MTKEKDLFLETLAPIVADGNRRAKKVCIINNGTSEENAKELERIGSLNYSQVLSEVTEKKILSDVK